MFAGLSSTLVHAIHNQHRQVERMQERSRRALATLSPDFRHRVERVIACLDRRGAIAVVFWGKRTIEQQKRIIKEGHSPTTRSWHVMNTHNNVDTPVAHYVVRGEAADIVDARFLWGGPCANLHHPFWRALGFYAKEQGLEWGGDWKPPVAKHPDVAHVQLKHREFSQDIRGTRA